MFRNFTFKRLMHVIFLSLANLPMRSLWRARFVKLGGVKINGRSFIFRNVVFDRVAPERIIIGNNVRITDAAKILTHFLDPSIPGVHFRYGDVVIEDDVFIGIGSTICNSVTIGKGAIVGAGSVVTKDIPPYQIWAGNPARYIKDRAH
jgi:acetyltransferase-like isoleucine patch superfamily enzyme